MATTRTQNGFPLGLKLGGSFAFVIVLTMAVTLLAWNSASRLQDSQQEIIHILEQSAYVVAKEVDHLHWANQLANSFIMMSRFGGQLDYRQCDFGKWYYGFKDSAAYHGASADFRQIFDAIEQPHQALHDSARQVVSLMQADDREGALAVYRDETQRALTDVRAYLNQMREALRNESQRIVAEAEASASMANAIQWVVVAIATLLSVILATWIVRSIVTPMKDLEHKAMLMAQGDLSGSDVAVRYNDEIGRAAMAFNRMRQSIRELLSSMNSAISRVASAADELSAVTNETNAGVRRQQGETDQVATAMNEMSATVHEVARNTQGAANAAHGAAEDAVRGKRVVARSITTIENLATEIQRAGEVIAHLHDDAQDINKVLDVIQGIAEQTNLLALNAAIEAARAGEQGRGFAVVADEVRTLATRTHESTREIQSMIERLQNGANQAVDAMRVSSERASESVQQATEAGAALDDISSAVTHINDMNAQIASASEQQSAVADEIDRNIINISQIATENASASEQTMAASEELARLADELHELAGRFKI